MNVHSGSHFDLRLDQNTQSQLTPDITLFGVVNSHP